MAIHVQHTIPIKEYLAFLGDDYVKLCDCFIAIINTVRRQYRNNGGHFNIHPGNMTWDSVLDRPQIVEANVDRSHNDILYASPEQSNQIHRPVDFRSDFYSIAIIFYEHLATHPWKNLGNSIDNHANITVKITPLHRVREKTPIAFSNLLKKCLSKSAANRHSSYQSLIYDLEYVRDNLNDTDFEPNAMQEILSPDVEILFDEHKLKINEIIDTLFYNKEDFANVIKLVYPEEYCKDYFNKHLHSYFKQHDVVCFYFSASKHFKESSYFLTSLFARSIFLYIRDSILYTEDDIADFFKKLPDETNAIFHLLVPELDRIFSHISHQACIELPLNDDLMIAGAITKLLVFLTNKTTNVVLHVDNFENIDNTSQKILNIFNINPLPLGFLFSSLKKTQIKPKKKSDKIKYSKYELTSPSEDSIKAYIKSLFASAKQSDSDKLYNLLIQKTEAAPPLIFSFLKEGISNNSIKFDTGTKQWIFDFAALSEQKEILNYPGFLAVRSNRLNNETLQCLYLASKLGNYFEINTLAKGLQKTPTKVLQLLKPAINANIINNYSHPGISKTSNKLAFFCFSNGNIVKFANVFNGPDSTKNDINTLYQNAIYDFAEERYAYCFFDYCFETNKTLISELSYRLQEKIAIYYYRKAKNLYLYNIQSKAVQSINYSISLLKNKVWENQYSLAKNIYLLAINIHLKMNNFNSSLALLEAVRLRLHEKQELVPYNHLIIAAEIREKRTKHVEERILECITISDQKKFIKQSVSSIVKEFVIFHLFKNRLYNKELSTKPISETSDDKLLAVYADFFADINSKYFHSLLPLIRNIVFEHGIKNCFLMPLIKRCNILINEDERFEYGIALAKALEQSFTDTPVSHLTAEKEYFYTHISPYISPFKTSAAFFKSAYDYYNDMGDISKAQDSFFQYAVRATMGQINLQALRKEIQAFTRKHTLPGSNTKRVSLIRIIKNLTENLINEKHHVIDPYRNIAHSSNQEYLFWYNLCYSTYTFINGEYNKSCISADNAKLYENNEADKMPQIILDYYYLLETLAGKEKADSQIAKKCKTVIKKYKLLADNCKYNFKDKYHILKAEYYRVIGKPNAAITQYKKAIYCSELENNLISAGLASKLLAAYLSSIQKVDSANIYFVKSFNYYKIWGSNTLANKIRLNNYEAFEKMQTRIYNI